MLLIYNTEGFADTLLCVFANSDQSVPQDVETNGDITIMRQAGGVVGINIARASEKFAQLPKGLALTQEGQDEVISYIHEQTGITDLPATLQQQFVVGHVQTKEAHPDSDKLSVCQVDVGNEMLQIVCGAQNVARGQAVVVAKIGSMMPSGLIIAPSVLRKVESNGMICSGKELNLPLEFQTPGILVLTGTPTPAPGTDFIAYFKEEMMEK